MQIRECKKVPNWVERLVHAFCVLKTENNCNWHWPMPLPLPTHTHLTPLADTGQRPSPFTHTHTHTHTDIQTQHKRKCLNPARTIKQLLAQDYDSFVSVQSHSDSAFDAETLPASSVQVGPCIQQHTVVCHLQTCVSAQKVSVWSPAARVKTMSLFSPPLR